MKFSVIKEVAMALCHCFNEIEYRASFYTYHCVNYVLKIILLIRVITRTLRGFNL